MDTPLPPPVDAAFFSALRRPTRFYIARHGQSVGNAKGLIQGLTDYPLDDTGRAQAAELGAWLAGRGVGACVASPLSRARETAEIACRAAGFPAPGFDPVLRELDTGVFSDLGWGEIERRHPAEAAAFRTRSWEAVPGAERVDSLVRRARASWSLVRSLALDSGGDVFCVTHGGFIQWLVRVTFGVEDSWMPLFPTGNCGVFELEVVPHDGGAYRLWRSLNFLPVPPATPPVF